MGFLVPHHEDYIDMTHRGTDAATEDRPRSDDEGADSYVPLPRVPSIQEALGCGDRSLQVNWQNKARLTLERSIFTVLAGFKRQISALRRNVPGVNRELV
jgi:hypothetical protein